MIPQTAHAAEFPRQPRAPLPMPGRWLYLHPTRYIAMRLFAFQYRTGWVSAFLPEGYNA